MSLREMIGAAAALVLGWLGKMLHTWATKSGKKSH